jgi:hypothetical protein
LISKNHKEKTEKHLHPVKGQSFESGEEKRGQKDSRRFFSLVSSQFFHHHQNWMTKWEKGERRLLDCRTKFVRANSGRPPPGGQFGPLRPVENGP